MTSRHQDGFDVLAALPVASRDPRQPDAPPPWSVRLRARLSAARYDRQIEDGVSPAAGSPLALHVARLISPRERDDLAHALRLVVHDADRGQLTVRAPVQSAAVHRGEAVIEAVRERLTDPFPVRARGMARLRILLSDGRGPLYRPGMGTLTAALRGVLAAL